MSPRLDGVRRASFSYGLALMPFILQKSRMRRRARTDLCGGAQRWASLPRPLHEGAYTNSWDVGNSEVGPAMSCFRA